MRITTESNATIDSRTEPMAQVIPFPESAIRRKSPQAIQYEQTKEYEERVTRIREKIERINRLTRMIQEQNNE